MRLCRCGHGRNKHAVLPEERALAYERNPDGTKQPRGECRGIHGIPCSCVCYNEDSDWREFSPEMLLAELKRACTVAFPERSPAMHAHMDQVFYKAKAVEKALRIAHAVTEAHSAARREIEFLANTLKVDLFTNRCMQPKCYRTSIEPTSAGTSYCAVHAVPPEDINAALFRVCLFDGCHDTARPNTDYCLRHAQHPSCAQTGCGEYVYYTGGFCNTHRLARPSCPVCGTSPGYICACPPFS